MSRGKNSRKTKTAWGTSHSLCKRSHFGILCWTTQCKSYVAWALKRFRYKPSRGRFYSLKPESQSKQNYYNIVYEFHFASHEKFITFACTGHQQTGLRICSYTANDFACQYSCSEWLPSRVLISSSDSLVLLLRTLDLMPCSF